MKEIQGWHRKHTLRKVPDEEKHRPKFTTDVVQPNVPVSSVEEQTEKKSKAWRKLSKVFKRKGSRSKPKEGSVLDQDTAGNTTTKVDPPDAPKSLVEQRAAELESFFVSYTKSIQRDRSSAASLPSSHDEKSGVDNHNHNQNVLADKDDEERQQQRPSGTAVENQLHERTGPSPSVPTGVKWDDDVRPKDVRSTNTEPPKPKKKTRDTPARNAKNGPTTTKKRPSRPKTIITTTTTTNDDASPPPTRSKSQSTKRRNGRSPNEDAGEGRTRDTSATTGSAVPTARGGVSLFGYGGGRRPPRDHMTEAERRRKERKARLSQTLF
jgi:hypothetical protein